MSDVPSDGGETRAPTQAADSPKPIYPSGLAIEGIDGEVLAAFRIDSAGRMMENTGHIMEATNREFAVAVCSVLPIMKWNPAILHGRAIPVWIREEFDFKH